MSAEPGRMWGAVTPKGHETDLADIERRHSPADGLPRVDGTGRGPGSCRGRRLHQPTPLAARLRARRRRGGRAHPHQTLPVRLRPSHAQHFARWLSIPAQRAVELFDELAGELEQVELDRTPGWTMAGDTSTPPQPHRGSAYWATSRPSWPPSASGERLYPGAAATRGLTPAGQAGNYPVLLVNGAVGGYGTSSVPVVRSPSPWSHWTS